MASSSNGKVWLTAKVPVSLKRDLEALARRNYTSMSTELRQAVAAHLERAKA